MRGPTLTQNRARRLRRALSPPEALLWLALRKREPGRPAFRRQHPLGPYILDFYCDAARLVVEVDGANHDHRLDHDARRDAWLQEQGLLVLRYPAVAVLKSLDEVAELIRQAVRERTTR
jgi:very-short-patch-repair endonuclease